MDREIDRVVPLDELSDYEVARGEPDVRGWDVIAGDGTRIGEVDELLVDTAARKVRFLDVTVDEELVHDPEVTQRVLIPIGSARVEEEDDRVVVDGLTSTEIFQAEEPTRLEAAAPDAEDGPALAMPGEGAIVEADPPPPPR